MKKVEQEAKWGSVSCESQSRTRDQENANDSKLFTKESKQTCTFLEHSFSSVMGSQEAQLLAVVVDSSLVNCVEKCNASNSNHLLQSVLDALLTFVQAHVMKSLQNKLVVLSCNSSRSEILYPTLEPSDIASDGRHELCSEVDHAVRTKLGSMLLETLNDNTKNDSLLAGAMARTLCYINHVTRTLPPSQSLNSRILVVSSSSDSALQYMTFMNVFFTAQKHNIVIDACMLGADNSLLQQGTNITTGQYLVVPQLQGLVEYLMWVFLPSPSVRGHLLLPPPKKTDYRAACFCHRTLVDIGYVCSSCLSIFCKFSPICTTCHAVFKGNAPLPVKLKKKKPRLD